jgi:DNA polymerase III alpha subunit
MWFEVEIVKNLTDKELQYLTSADVSSLANGFKKLQDWEKITSRRLATINDLAYIVNNPGRSLEDAIDWIATVEEDYLGISITCSKTDALEGSIQANVDCITYLRSPPKNVAIAATVASLTEYTINKGKNIGNKMGFLSINDTTSQVNCVLFTNVYEKYKFILNKGATVLVIGTPSPKDRSSLLVNKVVEI